MGTKKATETKPVTKAAPPAKAPAPAKKAAAKPVAKAAPAPKLLTVSEAEILTMTTLAHTQGKDQRKVLGRIGKHTKNGGELYDVVFVVKQNGDQEKVEELVNGPSR